MSHTNLHSVIDVECVNSVSNRSKDIISFRAELTRFASQVASQNQPIALYIDVPTY